MMKFLTPLLLIAGTAIGLDNTPAPVPVPLEAPAPPSGDSVTDPYWVCVDELDARIEARHPDIGIATAFALAQAACLHRTDTDL